MFFGLPTLYTSLTKADGAAATDFSSLRMALSAAEVLSAEVFNGWKALTGLEIIEGLGSTEALHIYLSNRPEKKKLGAAGLRVPGYEILLKDKDGREVGDNEEGILWVRGDSNTPLYWNRPDKSAETIREGGWIYTGDRFLRDADGFHFFRGRADDLIKISGQWVYPLEVELCLAEHPDIRECAVFAAELPDRRMTLKAVVVMNKGEFDTQGCHQDAAGLRQGETAALQVSARDQVHRGAAEDRYGQDRPSGVDEDVATPSTNSSVVPAKAGTHNHQCLLFGSLSLQRAQHNFLWLWVPAFAGTTADFWHHSRPRPLTLPSPDAPARLRRAVARARLRC